MTTKKLNRVQVFYNAEHKPYLYGAVHIVCGDVENQWWERPFVISKRRSNGEEVVYGTVKRTLDKIMSQVDRIQEFHVGAKAELDAEGIAPLSQERLELPESEVTDRILHEQEGLLEDALLVISVNIRILSELFPQKLKKSKTNVYDYDSKCVGTVELSKVADLLLHNRYITH